MSSVNEAKTRILSRVPLVELIGESISPRRQSGRIVGLCPFHEEKTPSFHIFDDHYHCFGCRAHGDAISYVQSTQGLGFIDALKWLAQKFSIEVPELERPVQNPEKFNRLAAQARILLHAQEFFLEALKSPAGEQTRKYLNFRGFDDEAIARFGFGFAPPGTSTLCQQLLSQGFRFDDIKDCSLANGTVNRPFDFFQNRVMIPIRDVQGRLIAFGGRTMGGEPQKYKNSRYDKGFVLFGMDRARKAISTKGRAIVVEGYMDALQMWRAGYEETVACQGTALTINHMKLLNNATDKVFLMFDGDTAGQSANLKLIEDALEFSNLEFRVALLPDDDDPDSVLAKHGKTRIDSAIASAVDLIDFGIGRKIETSSTTGIPELVSKELIGWLAKIDHKIKQEYLIGRLAEKSGIHSDAIRVALAGGTEKKRLATKVEAPNGAEQVEIIKDISPIARELLGHLYYSQPTDFNMDDVRRFVTNELREGSVWEGLAMEFLGAIEAGKLPHTLDLGYWSAAQIDAVAKVLTWIRDSQAAFDCQDRRRRLAKLQLVHRQKSIEKSISYMKNRLTTSGPMAPADQGEWQEIMRAVTQLNAELKNLQIQLNQ